MIAIYEPLYLPDQQVNEPGFQGLRLPNNAHAHWREFRIIVDMYRQGLHRGTGLTGLFSPKFRLKAGISGQEFVDFAESNSDADVCFVNPFPHLAYISYNAWMQGEYAHPGIVKRAQTLLDVSGVRLKIESNQRHGQGMLCYCNFWAGNEAFWDAYVGGVLLPIAQFLEKNPDAPEALAVLEQTTHTANSPFLPFIVERLFSTYLSQFRATVTVRAYPIDALKACLNDYERVIVRAKKQQIDAADRDRSLSDAQREDMRVTCELWQMFTRAYYAQAPHPHSGSPLPSATSI